MLMRDTDILTAVKAGKIEITPFDESKLRGTSYDLAIGGEALVSNADQKILLAPNDPTNLQLGAGDFALVLTKESVKMPLDVAASIGMRSSLARKGLILLAGMQIDPGFEGHLRFGLYNASPRRITLDYDDDLCMIEFHQLSGPVDRPQPPIPDLIKGRIPEHDRDFLRSLETESLSDLSNNVRALTQSVQALTAVTYRFVLPFIIAILAGMVVAIIVMAAK